MTEQPVRCGNCGADTATIRGVSHNDGGVGFRKLILICTGCKERSIIVPPAPSVEIQWDEGSEGVFGVGWVKDT